MFLMLFLYLSGSSLPLLVWHPLLVCASSMGTHTWTSNLVDETSTKLEVLV